MKFNFGNDVFLYKKYAIAQFYSNSLSIYNTKTGHHVHFQNLNTSSQYLKMVLSDLSVLKGWRFSCELFLLQRFLDFSIRGHSVCNIPCRSVICSVLTSWKGSLASQNDCEVFSHLVVCFLPPSPNVVTRGFISFVTLLWLDWSCVGVYCFGLIEYRNSGTSRIGSALFLSSIDRYYRYR